MFSSLSFQPPHFHAEYNNEEAAFAIETLSKIAGSLPPRITGYVIEWVSQHQQELMNNWEMQNKKGTFEKVSPLIQRSEFFLLYVESAKYYDDYKLTVLFNDTCPIILALKDISLFKDFTIKNHTISWSNGLDFAPEYIKDCSIKVLNEIA